jgi:hypothetical protein
VIRRVVCTVAVLACAAFLVACGGTEAGTPTAADRTSAGPEPTTTAADATTSSAPDDSELVGLDPCTLPPAEQLAGLGFTRAGEPQTALDAKLCTWAEPGRSVSVTLDPSNGVDDLNTGAATSVEDVTIGRHEGRRVLESSGPGFCSIDIAVTESSSATVTGIDFDGTPLACDLALQVAAIVEPKLP